MFAFITLFISIILYLFAPNHYSYGYCLIVFSVFVVSSIWHIKRSSYGNYLNFHTLFLVSYFFSNYAYPVFLFPNNRDAIYFFHYTFDTSRICISIALSLIGSSAFIFGSYIMRTRKIVTDISGSTYNYNKYVPILKGLSYIFFVLFLFFVGRDFYRGYFNSESESSNYFIIGFQTFVSLSVIVICYINKNRYSGKLFDFLKRFKIPFLLFLLVFISFFFFQGNRGPALQLLLIIATGYSLYVKRVPFRTFIISIIIGMFLMTFISAARVTKESGYEGDNSIISFVERGMNGVRFTSFMDLGSELINVNRDLYFALDHVDKNGVNYGRTMLSYIPAVIPGFGSYIVNLFDLDRNSLTSSALITTMVLGKNANWGLGTHMIGDIYMSFGVVGILVFMILFGYFNTRFQLYAIYTRNIYYAIAYLISVSYSVYYPRASCLISFRYILWPILIMALFKYLIPVSQKVTSNEMKLGVSNNF